MKRLLLTSLATLITLTTFPAFSNDSENKSIQGSEYATATEIEGESEVEDLSAIQPTAVWRYVCVARDRWGYAYRGKDKKYRRATREALRRCHRHSYVGGCRIRSCSFQIVF